MDWRRVGRCSFVLGVVQRPIVIWGAALFCLVGLGWISSPNARVARAAEVGGKQLGSGSHHVPAVGPILPLEALAPEQTKPFRSFDHQTNASDDGDASDDGGSANEPSPPLKNVLVRIRAGDSRAGIRAWVNQAGGRVSYEYRILPDLISVKQLPESKLAELTAHPSVAEVMEDRRVYVNLLDSTPRINGLQTQITDAGFSLTGSGARICIVDTGVNATHTMYEGRVDLSAGYDFVNNDGDPSDDNGHGSHVAGIAAGRTGLTVAFPGGGGLEPLQGIAPESTIIAVKVLDQFGGGDTSDVIAGIDHCTSPLLPGGPAHVINLSLGDQIAHTRTCDTDPLAMAANNAVSAGAVVVAAAGNNGFSNAMHSPACASGVISVGSTYDDPFPNPDFPPFNSFTFCTQRNVFGTCIEECTDDFPQADDIPCYSNGGSELDVTAPGSYIWSAVHDSPGLIAGHHGTSQASPHVAGLAALIKGAQPALSPAVIRQFIRDGAVDLGAPGFDGAYGHGRIDILGTLSLAFGCSGDAECDDSLYCTGIETCVSGQCESTGYPCGSQLCREADDTCVDCLADSDCDDGNDCNGIESCDPAGQCMNGSISDCNNNTINDACDLAGGTSNDCNNNATPDECDVATGGSSDCNTNTIPDECEIDCNLNGAPDDCDISSGFSNDCNGNGNPDECDVSSGGSPDCNSNQLPDECDIDSGFSNDCNGNENPDECDVAAGSSSDCNLNQLPDECETDCNNNGTPDDCDIASGSRADCDLNAIPDDCDIADGAQDCDSNSIPDTCEPDCNLNGFTDACDIMFGTSVDCQGNSVPDECDVGSGASNDCNSNEIPDECELDCNLNSIPDSCDISSGTSMDCNSNGRPDECDLAHQSSLDCNVNGIPDECDIADGTSEDCNSNGTPDECDIEDDIGGDCNGDMIPDECQPDCNGNDEPDDCDIASGVSQDCNSTAVPDECEIAAGTVDDCNGNGVPDSCEIELGGNNDCNGNGVPDSCDIASGDSHDCNVNGIPDECEEDCNGNSRPDDCDLANGTSLDCNGNSIPDTCDIGAGRSTDCDMDLIPDECEGDCNFNGTPDPCDITSGVSRDCNGNDVPDECDVAALQSEDCNGNGIPDECELDCDNNGEIDACEPPVVAPVGSRYISIVPAPSCAAGLMAILVESPDWGCLSRYVNSQGYLVDAPVFQSASEWGEILVGDREIIPDSAYRIYTVRFGSAGMQAVVSTWVWGDVDGNGLANFGDVLAVVQAFQGMPAESPIELYDLEPCVPNRRINFSDVFKVAQAFSGTSFTESGCSEPCN